MKICVIQHGKVPVKHYGGTERVIENLCNGYVQRGHQVTLICYPGDYEIAGINFIDLGQLGEKANIPSKFIRLVPTDTDIIHFHVPWKQDELDLPCPYLCTLHGNEEDSEKRKQLPKNLVGVSKNHAERHGARFYVYNGLDFSKVSIGSDLENRNGFSFLGRASLKRKGLFHAKRLVKELKESLNVGGGRGINWPWSSIKFLGHLNDEQKYSLLRESKALLFPIEWQEPFGLVMIEAMAVGTPVFALERGSVSEVLGLEGSDGLFVKAANIEELVKKVKNFDYSVEPQKIREYVDLHFSTDKMCDDYLKIYDQIRAEQA